MTSPYRHHGFSLIELMCSMAIGSILLLAAAAVLGSYGSGYERVGGGVATEREARAVITRLTADLATARFHKDTLMDPSSGSGSAERLRFLCLRSAQAQSEAGRIGDLCAVNYYLKDLSIHGKTVRCLMRGCRDSKDTFTALDDKHPASLFAECSQSDEPIAFGVVSFEARRNRATCPAGGSIGPPTTPPVPRRLTCAWCWPAATWPGNSGCLPTGTTRQRPR